MIDPDTRAQIVALTRSMNGPQADTLIANKLRVTTHDVRMIRNQARYQQEQCGGGR